MSTKHPIISVVGSSGAGTSTVKDTFEKIFLRENVSAAMIEGDAFHKFNRTEMKAELERRYSLGDQTFSHFSYDANLLDELEKTFKNYGEKVLQKRVLMFIILMKVNSIMFLLVNLPIGVIYLMILTFFFMKDYMVRLNLKISIFPNIQI